jgi:hypothetical protein
VAGGSSTIDSSIDPYIPVAPIVKNFAPDGEPVNKIDAENIIHWEAAVGGGNMLRFQTWKKTNTQFVSLRKAPNVGATIPAHYTDGIIKALKTMKKDCSKFFPLQASQ